MGLCFESEEFMMILFLLLVVLVFVVDEYFEFFSFCDVFWVEGISLCFVDGI